MTWILWIVLAILWTFLVLIAGYYSGWINGKKEAAETKAELVYNTGSIEVTDDQIDRIKRYVFDQMVDKYTGPMGQPGKDGKTPNANDLIVDESLELTLAEWKLAVDQRLTRVERKAGMSV